MDKLYEELFRAMNQFRKLKFAEMFPMINRTDFFVMCTIMDKGENGKITISELASRAKMLPSAISRTLKGLEERGYVERNINKKHLISYLDNIYHIAEKEIEARKGQGRRKEREHE